MDDFKKIALFCELTGILISFNLSFQSRFYGSKITFMTLKITFC